MKKLIINALGIVSVLTMLTMVVVKVCWADKVDDDQVSVISDQVNGVSVSENKLASMCDRIDHLSDNVRDIKPQNTVTHSNAYSSSSRHIFDESLLGDSYTHDPTDYPSKDSFDTDNDRKINRIDNYEEAKAADVIE